MIEIGSGTGFLTERLLEKTGGHVTAIELDDRWAGHLKKNYASRGLHVIHEDALKCDWDQLSVLHPDGSEGRWIVCGNIPYSISSPLIEKIIGWKSHIKDTVLLLQREFAERVCAQTGSRNSNSLACWVQIHGKPEILFHVGPGNFWPPPKVESSLMRIKWRKEALIPDEKQSLYKKLLKTGFNQRRKKISNSLSRLCESKEELAGIFRSAGVDSSLRPEALLISDWIRLSEQHFSGV